MRSRTYKKLSISLLLLFLASLLFGFGYEMHNNQLIESVYGLSGGWSTMKGMSELVKKKYYIFSDALYLAVDYNGAANQGQKLANLKQNLLDIGASIDDIPSLEKFNKLGGGNHRAYNHQGFNYDYSNSVKSQRWELGKELLTSSIKKAYKVSDEVADVLAKEGYYTHMIGDLLEGKISSVLQMGELSNFGDLIDSFADEISNNKAVRARDIRKIRRLAKKYKKVKITEGLDSDALASVRKQIEKGQDELADIFRKINKKDLKWDGDIPELTAKTKKLNTLTKAAGQSALSGLVSAGVVAGLELITEGKITDYKAILRSGGIGVASSLLDSGAAYLSKKAVSKVSSKLLKGVTSVGIAVAADSAIDIVLLFSDYKNGDITLAQFGRNSAIKTASNVAAFVAANGVAGLLTSVSVVNPVVGLVSIGIYFGTSFLADKITDSLNLSDIKKGARDSKQLTAWTNEYWAKITQN